MLNNPLYEAPKSGRDFPLENRSLRRRQAAPTSAFQLVPKVYMYPAGNGTQAKGFFYILNFDNAQDFRSGDADRYNPFANDHAAIRA